MGLTILYELILLLLRGSAEPGMQPAKCPSIRLKANSRSFTPPRRDFYCSDPFRFAEAQRQLRKWLKVFVGQLWTGRRRCDYAFII